MSSQEIAELTNELRSVVDSQNKEDALVKDKLGKIEERLNEYESKNEKLLSEIKQEQKVKEQLEENIDNLEKQIHRVPKHSDNYEAKTNELKAFENYILQGARNISEEEHKYLRTDNDPDGGYLAPTEYVQEIIRKITEVSPVRQVARIRTTSRESITIPKRNGLVSAAWIGEGGNFPVDTSNFGVKVIHVNKLGVVSVVTTEMLSDAAFDIEQEINNDIAEEFASFEGAAFINGNGVEKPEGMLNNPDVQTVVTGVSNDITADSLIEIAGELKDGYNPAYMLNRRTLARIRQLKDGNGQYLWQPGLAQGQPNTINGFPYFSAIDLDDVANNNYPVLFGDYERGYTIVDGDQMTMLRDPYSNGRSGKVEFVAHRRVGGQVVLPEAIKKLQVST